MLKKIIVSIVCLLPLMFLYGADEEILYPRVRPQNENVFPVNFRKSNSPYIHKFNSSISREGLDQLRASASGQFSEKSLERVISELAVPNLIIVDLRRECHGFVNGCAISWKLKQKIHGQSYEYNVGVSADQIENRERSLLDEILQKGAFSGMTDDGTMMTFVPKTVMTERQLCNQLGIRYIRLPIADHQHPLAAEVDEFIALVKTLPPNAWLHFHCAAGEGRATTLMTMFDMMHNSHHLTAQAIMQRQEAIGGGNMYRPEAYAKNSVPAKYTRAKQRLDFLLSFYRYCVENLK